MPSRASPLVAVGVGLWVALADGTTPMIRDGQLAGLILFSDNLPAAITPAR